jgi:methionine-S-sulfoxide reductase
VGYSGGTLDGPTYRRIGDHSESIQIEYDPGRIAYRQLLKSFWRDHDPTRSAWRRQYMSVAFYHDEDQHRIIMETKVEEEARRNKAIVTEIRPAGIFFRAEDYHQKYYLRQQRQLAGEFISIYPRPKDFTDSTATARVNGYLGGNGTLDQLSSELPQLGLSKIGQERLKEQIGYRLN